MFHKWNQPGAYSWKCAVHFVARATFLNLPSVQIKKYEYHNMMPKLLRFVMEATYTKKDNPVLQSHYLTVKAHLHLFSATRRWAIVSKRGLTLCLVSSVCCQYGDDRKQHSNCWREEHTALVKFALNMLTRQKQQHYFVQIHSSSALLDIQVH